MRTFLTRTLPAALIVVAATLGGYFARGYLPRSATPVPAQSRPVPPISATNAAAADGPSATSEVTAAAAETAPAIPEALPDIAFEDRAGTMRRLSDWKGHPLLINFWAPWCAPCRAEIPLLEDLSRSREPQGLRVIGIAVDSRAAVLDYARRAAIPYPLLIGQQPGLKVVAALGLEAVFPFSVFVDARGRIVTLKIGALRADQAAFILDRVGDLDQHRIDLPTARRQIADGMAKLAVAHAKMATNSSL